ncbi:unnamed protein product [Larinioides sclopetarius]|uniref:Uncharacterized protein n=1 Tax=Larinioides sclopetarius TaxID=280406 RepID=A0AAV2BP71_9ARAC
MRPDLGEMPLPSSNEAWPASKENTGRTLWRVARVKFVPRHTSSVLEGELSPIVTFSDTIISEARSPTGGEDKGRSCSENEGPLCPQTLRDDSHLIKIGTRVRLGMSCSPVTPGLSPTT